jgi:hypothetical protein
LLLDRGLRVPRDFVDETGTSAEKTDLENALRRKEAAIDPAGKENWCLALMRR